MPTVIWIAVRTKDSEQKILLDQSRSGALGRALFKNRRHTPIGKVILTEEALSASAVALIPQSFAKIFHANFDE
jgi:hypothetical protein